MNIPNHVAIILDGNGRWAKSKGMPRNYGHVRGAQNLEVICRDAYNMGIKYLTVYLFSTENWKRSPDEVDALMKLFRRYTKTCIRTARDNNMKVRVLGDPTALADDLQESLKKLVESSKDNTGLNFQIAINYGSRDEIVRAIRKVAADCVDGQLKPEEITEERFSGYLDTAEVPDPDLLIRTSGEQRLSNYLLWQLAYTEFYFTEVPWPAFTKEELAKAITDEIRKGHRIDTTTKLREVIGKTLDFLPEKEKKDTIKKTCQRTFQALRIDVNREFEVLYEFMEKLPGALKPGGRVAILTFHSGEDKLVKRALKEGCRDGIYADYSKDVVRPSAEECAQNGRARSTKMRWAIRAEE